MHCQVFRLSSVCVVKAFSYQPCIRPNHHHQNLYLLAFGQAGQPSTTQLKLAMWSLEYVKSYCLKSTRLTSFGVDPDFLNTGPRRQAHLLLPTRAVFAFSFVFAYSY